ncbi:hypothetical protein [Nocardia stercoris]|uniref:Uncharacterized protein n=1 Tax=Nocardia stercoris TaxID=2483361 RepID=A0A3M2L8C3_9NOCA|nr:hypothetical protein [Nocardia stercoris]RMI32930.1 hypothetical protein EBN03_13535 [Nocardia stercoris]
MKWMSRVFASNDIPPQLRSALTAEGVVVSAAAGGSLARRNTRAPLHYTSSGWEHIAGGVLTLTQRRLLIFGNRQALIDVPLGHPAVVLQQQDADRLLVEVDNGRLAGKPGWTTALLRSDPNQIRTAVALFAEAARAWPVPLDAARRRGPNAVGGRPFPSQGPAGQHPGQLPGHQPAARTSGPVAY